MIEWNDTFVEQLKAMSDKDLLEAYRTSSGEAGEPVFEALVAEIQTRNLDI